MCGFCVSLKFVSKNGSNKPSVKKREFNLVCVSINEYVTKKGITKEAVSLIWCLKLGYEFVYCFYSFIYVNLQCNC